MTQCALFSSLLTVSQIGNHRATLHILVDDLGDSTSAETYCALGGEIIPPKTAQSIAVDAGLQDLATTLFGLPPGKSVNGKGAAIPIALSRSISVNEDLKKELLKILLEVYMSVQCVDSVVCFPNNHSEGQKITRSGFALIERPGNES